MSPRSFARIARIGAFATLGAVAACAGPPAVPVNAPTLTLPGVEGDGASPDAQTTNVPGAPDASSPGSAVIEPIAVAPVANVAVCPKVCKGTVPASLVRALQERGSMARRCYNAALRTDRTLIGRIRVVVGFADDGSLCELRTKESDMPPDMTACTLRLFEQGPIPYPLPVGGCVSIEIPMRFEPQPADAGTGASD